MRKTRKHLTLTKEAIRHLTSSELPDIAGGELPTNNSRLCSRVTTVCLTCGPTACP